MRTSSLARLAHAYAAIFLIEIAATASVCLRYFVAPRPLRSTAALVAFAFAALLSSAVARYVHASATDTRHLLFLVPPLCISAAVAVARPARSAVVLVCVLIVGTIVAPIQFAWLAHGPRFVTDTHRVPGMYVREWHSGLTGLWPMAEFRGAFRTSRLRVDFPGGWRVTQSSTDELEISPVRAESTTEPLMRLVATPGSLAGAVQEDGLLCGGDALEQTCTFTRTREVGGCTLRASATFAGDTYFDAERNAEQLVDHLLGGASCSLIAQ